MFLGLDLGTTNVKAVVTSEKGKVLGHGSCGVDIFHLGNGGVEQDIEQIWNATITATRQAGKTTGLSEIRAIGVSSQGGAMQMPDANGRPSGRVVSWLDQRGRPYNDALTKEFGQAWFTERVGHSSAGVAIGQLLRLRAETPEFLESGNRVGFVGDLIVQRLCGYFAHDGTSAALTLLYNPHRRDYDPELLTRLGVQKKQLPDLLAPSEAAGMLTVAASREMGLSAGIPVSTAIHDQYAAALGTGAINPGTTMIGAGTAWVLLAVSDCPTTPIMESAFACHHVIPGLFGQIVSLVNGGSALTWAIDLLNVPNCSTGEIEQLLASVPAGSEGISFWPFLARRGASGLAASASGRFAGLQLSHRPAHVLRAVVEGLAFELNRHLLWLRREGVAVERLVMGGAVAASSVTPQIIADVTGVPLTCFSAEAGSVLGAAILASSLVEHDVSLEKLVEEMLRESRIIQPGSSAPFYSDRFAEYANSLRLIEH